eukprot:gb/GEZN01003004.1/.p1 GENE.gb/GEZN01003004.1/~~gb/GEZN01003004.1/.p1  ORF type:complete len:539 (-),score=79.97 gb/GEZN01003004.1/:594-2210(-)
MFGQEAQTLQGANNSAKLRVLGALVSQAFGHASNSANMASNPQLLAGLLMCLKEASLQLSALKVLNNVACNAKSGRALVANFQEGALLSAVAACLSSEGETRSKAIGTLSFLSHNEVAASRMAEGGIVTALYKVRQKEEQNADATLAVMAIANIIGREEKSKLVADESAMSTIVSLLRSSLDGSHFAQLCWVPEYVLPPLVNLTVSDANKVELLKHPVIELLIQVLSDWRTYKERYPKLVDVAASQELALDALSNLCFDETSCNRVKAAGVVEMLQKLFSQAQGELKEKSDRLLWMVKGRPATEVEEKLKSTDQKHIMISYSWAQKGMRILATKLKEAGFKVWLDVNEMSGSTVEAMASAVENSSLVIIGVSKAYQQSANCRLECEYAHQRKIPWIPVMAEANFQPNGWLGILMGSKLWFPFSEGEVENAVHNLLPEVRKVLHMQLRDKEVSPVSSIAAESPQKWGPKEVRQWLESFSLHEMAPKLLLDELDGSCLCELAKLRKDDPRFFYDFLSKDLQIEQAVVKLRLAHALCTIAA